MGSVNIPELFSLCHCPFRVCTTVNSSRYKPHLHPNDLDISITHQDHSNIRLHTAIMLITNLHALVALIPLVASLPSMPSFMNKLKSLSSRDDQCPFPDSYKITSLQVWTPKNGNTHPIVVDFQYADDETKIATSCHYNGTQPNVGPEGLAPRYACENPTVQFQWIQKTSMLSIIELACPNTPES